ncbi:hypothetical protein LJR099_003080 [Variovorax paradoxus]|uniref:hypothetical protein n=1 Tax=Variovorax paradoxus TaxID=34073 RepID=UPI003999DAC6
MNGLTMLGIWTAAAMIISTVVGWVPLSAWLETHDKLAGWAQAVGSVVAIAAGALAVWWQVHRQAVLQTAQLRAEEVRRLSIMLSAVFDLRARLKVSTWHELGPYQGKENWNRTDEAVELLRSIPLFEVPDWQVAFAVRQAVDTYALLRRTVPYEGVGDPTREWHNVAYELVETAVAHCAQTQRHIHDALVRRDAKVPVLAVEVAGGWISSNEE